MGGRGLKKTYILAPNFDYPPSGPIGLGRIWTNATDPSSCLNSLETPDLTEGVEIHKTWKTDWTGERERQRQGLLGIWVRFLQLIGIDAESSISWDRTKVNAYKFDKLESLFFDPPPEYVGLSMQSLAVSNYIAKSNYKKSVYMFTGLKIARGAEVKIVRSHGLGTDSKVGADGMSVGFPVSAGPEISISTKNSDSYSFGASSDFVFAYRLREIYYEKGQIQTKEHNKKALYSLNDDTPQEVSIMASDDLVESLYTLKVIGLASNDLSIKPVQHPIQHAIDDEDGEECDIIAPI